MFCLAEKIEWIEKKLFRRFLYQDHNCIIFILKRLFPKLAEGFWHYHLGYEKRETLTIQTMFNFTSQNSYEFVCRILCSCSVMWNEGYGNISTKTAQEDRSIFIACTKKKLVCKQVCMSRENPLYPVPSQKIEIEIARQSASFSEGWSQRVM